MSFTVNDFADAVIHHEYGTFHADPLRLGLTREGPYKTQRHLPFVMGRPSQPVTFGHVGHWDRSWRQQHHVGHGFFPAGFDEGVFVPPGSCLAPWECDVDSDCGADMGHEDHHGLCRSDLPGSDMLHLVRHPHYVPFVGAEASHGAEASSFGGFLSILGHVLDPAGSLIRDVAHSHPGHMAAQPYNPWYGYQGHWGHTGRPDFHRRTRAGW